MITHKPLTEEELKGMKAVIARTIGKANRSNLIGGILKAYEDGCLTLKEVQESEGSSTDELRETLTRAAFNLAQRHKNLSKLIVE